MRPASVVRAVGFAAGLWLAAAPGLAEERADDGVLADLPFLDGAGPAAIQIDLAPEGHARPLRLQLDTGATSSAMTPGMAREQGVSVRRLKTTPYRRATRLGRELQFQVHTRSGDQAARGAPFEYGLLGGNFLSHYVVEIDYPARRVRFLDPERHALPETSGVEGTSILPLRLVANRPIVDVSVDGRTLPVLLDTGSPVGVILGGRSVEALDLEARALLGLRLFGVVGEVKTGFAEAATVRLGNFAFRHVPLVLAPRGLHQQATASDSAIGHDLLANFRVRIDYPNRRLALEAAGPLESRLLGMPWTPVRASGALLELHEERLHVRFVVEGSPAATLGIRPGDVIDAVGTYPRPTDVAAVSAAMVAGHTLRVLRAGADGHWDAHVFGEPPG